MAQTTPHSAKALTATVDGQKVVGFADGDDVFTVEPGADIGEGLVGALGDSIFSQSADTSARITIKLLQTSPTHRLLSRRLQRQRRGTPSAFPVAYKDRINGEGGQGPCYIMTAPTEQKGARATTREWVLWCGDWSRDIPAEL